MFPEDHYTKASDVTIRYWAVGENGSPLILIHGLGASAEIWYPNVEALGRHYRVYVPDLPGFGRSTRPRDYTPQYFMHFLNDFMTSLGLERASLVGQSLGGGIALYFALMYPDKVDRLVLADSAGLGTDVLFTLRLMSLPVIGEMLVRPSRWGVALFFKLAVKNPAVITDDLVDVYYGFFRRRRAGKDLLRVLRSLITIGGTREDVLTPIITKLHLLKAPTLIIWGTHDRVLPLRHAMTARDKIRHATLLVYDACGHIPNLEMPERFNRDVRSFLAQSP